MRILPYLHVRKLFLNESKKNTNYYYTAIETTVEAEKKYNNNLENRYIKPGPYEIEIDEIKQEESQSGDPSDASMEELKTYTTIICMSITESMYNVYIQNGILINQVYFLDLVQRYGDPCSVSTDGTKFLFKHSQSSIVNT